jgi:hypothetical protein
VSCSQILIHCEVSRKATKLLLLWVFGLAFLPASAQSTSAADAKNHVGKKATPCGKVAKTPKLPHYRQSGSIEPTPAKLSHWTVARPSQARSAAVAPAGGPGSRFAATQTQFRPVCLAR